MRYYLLRDFSGDLGTVAEWRGSLLTAVDRLLQLGEPAGVVLIQSESDYARGARVPAAGSAIIGGAGHALTVELWSVAALGSQGETLGRERFAASPAEAPAELQAAIAALRRRWRDCTIDATRHR